MHPTDVPKKGQGSSPKKAQVPSPRKAQVSSPKKAQLSSASKDQPLLTLRFPKKLWKIVNDCKSGAISWSTDGTAIVIDYAKFQIDYLDNRLDIFKTKNITSFIRQLNLYGFRKVSPHYRVAVNNESPDLHIFRNDSFVRGRPDLLQEVTRKTGALRSKAHKHHGCLHKAPFQQIYSGIMQYQPLSGAFKDQAPRSGQGCCDICAVSNGGTCTELSEGRPQSRNKVPRHKHREEMASLERSSFAHEASLSAELLERCMDNTCHCSRIKWERTSLYSQDSTSDTTTSDDDCTANGVHQEGFDGDNHTCAQPLPPPTPASTPPRAGSTAVTWTLEYFPVPPPPPPPPPPRRRRAHAVIHADATKKPNGDIKALLDPNESPKVVLRHPGRDAERIHTPPIEDSFLLNDHVREAETPNNGSLCYVFTTEDVTIDVVEAAAAYIPSPAEAAAAAEAAATAAAAAAAAATAAAAAAARLQNSMFAKWEELRSTSPALFKTSTGMTSAYYCL